MIFNSFLIDFDFYVPIMILRPIYHIIYIIFYTPRFMHKEATVYGEMVLKTYIRNSSKS